MILNVTLVGNQELILRMEAMPGMVRDALKVKVRELGTRLQEHIVRDKLHGQVLGQRSGQLARSIQVRTESSGETEIAIVYSASDVKYAGFWEFGFHGTETVRAHDRVTTTLFGKAVDAYTQHVGTYSRQVDQAPRSFMRTGLADLAPTFIDELKATVEKAMSLPLGAG